MTSHCGCFLKNIYLFVCLFVLAALGLSCGIQDLRCGMWDPLLWHAGSFVAACGIFSCGMHAGSSSPTRDRTRAPCIGSV